MPDTNILVVGASIAGPMTAYWLAKAGANVTVIERFPELRGGGQSIDIRTTGVAVMRKIPGMEEAVRRKFTQLEGISLVRDNGQPYGTLKATGNPDQQSLVSEYEILRGDLSKILFDMTKDSDKIKYIFNEQIASMQQAESGDGPITVNFLNGFPTSTYDLVVACDGSTSRTRAMGLGCGLRDYVESTNSWAAFFSIDQDLAQGSKVGQGYNATGGRFVALGSDPDGVNRAVFMCLRPHQDAVESFREAMKQGEDALKGFVARHYQEVGWKTPEIIKCMMDSKDFYANEIVQIKPPTLFKGRFVLVGDAGYAPGPTGTGTTLAMTGAYTLAGELNKHKGDLQAGLEGYEKQMRPLIDDMQKTSSVIYTIIAPQTAWGIWIRNHIFAFITWSRIIDVAQRYLGGAFASGDKYALPEYEWAA
ncbi:hypothetical protein PV10_05139 [Exophiala mesophila]|uniref:FAD-binding domain-containing protein n=1 Tax=Exophiala mesophila TaxID=212818 RepID=A0A0D1Y0F8_EXOME|nr:uncharacterized protein PV10_05139 [Exophiala mesophila]KIV93971.1 hypothetical protein PV10_05139 [Exophiala mesophila]